MHAHPTSPRTVDASSREAWTTPPHRRSAPMAVLLTVPAAVALVGCGTGAEPPGPAVRDSAGVTIVQNEAPDPMRLPAWQLSAAPLLDIGSVEGTDEETLFRVVGAVRLSDGRVAVANGGTSEIRYYGPDGGHLRSVGGEGGGPGEFQRITRIIRMPGDSVAVMDLSARRVSVLSPEGAFVREIPTAVSGAMLSVAGLRPDGSWVASQNVLMSADGIQEGLTRPDVVWVSLPPEGGAPDTVGRFPGTERVIHIGSTQGRLTSVEVVTPPFGRATSVVPVGDDLVVATQDAAQVEVYGPDGALSRIVRTGVPLREVTAALVDEALQRRYADFPPDRRRDALKAAEGMPTGAFVPPYGDVMLDRSGRMWIQDYPDLSDENRWTVYAADGTPVASISLPHDFRPYDIGTDWILGHGLDELEVEHVRVYALTHP